MCDGMANGGAWETTMVRVRPHGEGSYMPAGEFGP